MTNPRIWQTLSLSDIILPQTLNSMFHNIAKMSVKSKIQPVFPGILQLNNRKLTKKIVPGSYNITNTIRKFLPENQVLVLNKIK